MSGMRIDVSLLLKGPVGSSDDIWIDETGVSETLDHIEGDVTLVRTNRGILVKGTVSARIKGTCSRCLEPAVSIAKLDIAEEVLQEMSRSGGFSPNNRSEYIINSNQVLDLNEIIAQYAHMARPMKFLCKPDCAGICPTCGYNLNQGSCACASQTHDSRWAKLINMRKEDSI